MPKHERTTNPEWGRKARKEADRLLGLNAKDRRDSIAEQLSSYHHDRYGNPLAIGDRVKHEGVDDIVVTITGERGLYITGVYDDDQPVTWFSHNCVKQG